MAEKFPKYSVLMSVYERDDPGHFCVALESMLNQTYPPSEIVMIVDGPIPGILQNRIDLVKSSAPNVSFRIIVFDSNQGLSIALRHGVLECSHDYIVRMDSDDYSLQDRVEKQIKYLNIHPEISMLGGWYQQFDSKMEKSLMMRKVPEKSNEIIKYAENQTPINHVTIIFRKKDYLKTSGYPKSRNLFEDWWLSNRFIINKLNIHNLQEVLVEVRGGDDFMNRRSGILYGVQEIKNMFQMWTEGHFSLYSFLKNTAIRFPVRVMPQSVRKVIYSYIRK
jgi:glycosyltransferase involved in cell wall biosynthesis